MHYMHTINLNRHIFLKELGLAGHPFQPRFSVQVRKQMTVFNVTKELYNVDVYTRHPSVLADGQPEDRGMNCVQFTM